MLRLRPEGCIQVPQGKRAPEEELVCEDLRVSSMKAEGQPVAG